MVKKEKIPTQDVITRDPFPRSRKVYVKGRIHDISVAMREIDLDDSGTASNGSNDSGRGLSITVYDTSGPYTDPNVDIDVYRGLQRLREKWILERGDVERL